MKPTKELCDVIKDINHHRRTIEWHKAQAENCLTEFIDELYPHVKKGATVFVIHTKSRAPEKSVATGNYRFFPGDMGICLQAEVCLFTKSGQPSKQDRFRRWYNIEWLHTEI